MRRLRIDGRRRTRLVVCGLSGAVAYGVQAWTAGTLAAHDPIVWVLKTSVARVGAVAAALAVSRFFLFFVLPVWLAAEAVTSIWVYTRGSS